MASIGLSVREEAIDPTRHRRLISREVAGQEPIQEAQEGPGNRAGEGDGIVTQGGFRYIGTRPVLSFQPL